MPDDKSAGALGGKIAGAIAPKTLPAIDVTMDVDAGTLTFKQRRNQFSIEPDTVVIPIVVFKQTFHNVLGVELQMLGVAPQAKTT